MEPEGAHPSSLPGGVDWPVASDVPHSVRVQAMPTPINPKSFGEPVGYDGTANLHTVHHPSYLNCGKHLRYSRYHVTLRSLHPPSRVGED